jgi:serine/threonine protein kinase
MINPHAVEIGMEDAAIEKLFRAEYDLPCCPHPNVIRVLHHFCDSVPPQGLPKWPEFGGGRSLFLVMKEYDCNLQTHCRHLLEKGLLDERFLLSILLQLFKATEHLVQHNILHLDLKLDNVLVKVEQTVTRAVICDFGCSYESPHSLTTANATVLSARVGGNPNHHPPELCTLSSDPTVVCDVSKADIWAVGLMAYEIVTGRDAATILSYQHKKTRYTSEILPQLEGSFSVSCSHLLQQFVSHSVESRPSASQAIQLCSIVLYGPTTPTLGEMTVEKAQHWLEQQLVSLRPKSNEDLRKDPFYMRYLDLFSPDVVKHVINKFLMR